MKKFILKWLGLDKHLDQLHGESFLNRAEIDILYAKVESATDNIERLFIESLPNKRDKRGKFTK